MCVGSLYSIVGTCSYILHAQFPVPFQTKQAAPSGDNVARVDGDGDMAAGGKACTSIGEKARDMTRVLAVDDGGYEVYHMDGKGSDGGGSAKASK